MFNNKIEKSVLISLFFISINCYAENKLMTAREIMDKAAEVDKGDTIEQDMIMTLVSKSNEVRKKEFKVYQKKYGDDRSQIMFIKSPKSLKNTAILTFDFYDNNKDDIQKIYIPAAKKIKRIPSSDQSSSFMGSDFSYHDLVRHNFDYYELKLIKEDNINGHDVWVIETKPINEKEKEESGYIKTIDFIRKDNFMLTYSIMFLKNKSQKKIYSVIKMHQENNIWIIDEAKMTTQKDEKLLHETIFKFKNIKINKSINDKMFTSRQLEKGI